MGSCSSRTMVTVAVHNHQVHLRVESPTTLQPTNSNAGGVYGAQDGFTTSNGKPGTAGALPGAPEKSKHGAGDEEDSVATTQSQVAPDQLASITLQKAESARYAQEEIRCAKMPLPGSPEANYTCSLRLKKLVHLVELNSVSIDVLIENLSYTINVLTAVLQEETRRLCNEDDDLPDNHQNEVPNEVREWLSSTFTRTNSSMRQYRGKPTFRSVANAIRAGIAVERIFRRMSSSTNLDIPPNIMFLMKNGIDDWNFDIFELNDAADNHCLKYCGFELIHRYNLMNKFKISQSALENFLGHLERGYSKNGNPYHNLIHGADVAQTCHIIMIQTHLLDWLTDLEVFAVLFAALIHDYEHTGTTNNFHINTNSELAILYNDRGVLENHHISASFRLMREEEDCGVLENMAPEDYREFRKYVIEMVLNTDMSLHFQQLKTMKNLLSMPDSIEKSKALSLMLHCADIGHPSKSWELHERWTQMLVEEFFRQGDREKDLGLPCSPLCDRKNTAVPQSQIGFIEFIVAPSFQILGEMLDTIMSPIFLNQAEQKMNDDMDPDENGIEDRCVLKPWQPYLLSNKEEWKARIQDK